MGKQKTKFANGDWLLHSHFGAGLVLGIETKQVSGDEKTYYRIETSNSTLWLPTEGMDESKIRPVSTPEEFNEAIDELRADPEEMDPNATERKKRIDEVKGSNIPEETAQLVRDLWQRQWSEKGLYDWEREAWRFLSSRLVQEWTLCEGIPAEEARQRLIQTLVDEQTAEVEGEEQPESVNSSLFDALADEDGKWSDWLAKALSEAGEPA